MQHWKRGLIFTPIALASMVISVHLIENWRGNRAWEEWNKSRRAQGDTSDMSAYMQPPIPDSENYAAHPAVARAMKAESEDPKNQLTELALPAQAPPSGSWTDGHREDLAAWEATLQARDLSAFLESYRVSLAGIEDASRRVRCRLPVDYTKGEIPTLFGHRGFTRTFRLRALVRLRQNHPAEAADDIQTIFRIANVLESDPALMTHLLRVVMVRLMGQPLWEGLDARAWNETQLMALQDSLSRLDLLKTSRRPFEVERLYWVQESHRRPQLYRRFISEKTWGEDIAKLGWGWRLLCGNFFPEGWILQNNLSHDRQWVEVFLGALPKGEHRLNARILDRAKASWAQREKGKASLGPYTVIASDNTPALIQLVKRTVRTQVFIDQAIQVCALERFRLAKGHYPSVLEELCPTYLGQLPEDPVGEGSYRYHRLNSDSFKLWSVGWDGKDDHGEPVMESDFVVMSGEGQLAQGWPHFEQNRKGPLTESLDRGDWAWPVQKQ